MIDFSKYHLLEDYTGWVPSKTCSDGEGIIRRTLDQYGFNSISQQAIQIPTEINPSGLAYLDIFVPNLNLVIEFQGGQHYDINNTKQQIRDNYVKDFCKYYGYYFVEVDALEHTDPNKNRHNLTFPQYLEMKTLRIVYNANLKKYAKDRA